MTGSRAATRYAKAVLEYATDKGVQEAVYNDMAHVLKTYADNEDLKTVIQSPVIKSDVKEATLRDVFAGVHAVTGDLFRLLVTNKRIELLPQVARSYQLLYEESINVIEAVVTSAVPLTAELEEAILQKVNALTGKNASLKKIVDETIIGGVILRVGDQQYNASIANKLQMIKRDFLQNVQIA